ncbi:MAG TPA: ATP-binding cassette domain-containing protein [Candidatus Hydrogenedentes bacterium]|nr:ATP-binding cassette domain-containing protein [Candidatus Hydrogenedentota bacterium]
MIEKGDVAISVQNLGVSYWMKRGAFHHRRFWALQDVSFDLHRGESLGVVGKNGAGKSTLLRILAGVMAPDRGNVINHGVTCSLLSLSLGFLPYLTGRENAVLGGMFQGQPKEYIQSRMEEIIAFAELGDFIDEPISSYSAGMRARLAFALAFQVNTDVLLIDEVIGVGDQDFQQKSMSVMKERIRSQDTTIVFVTHNGNLIKELCERTLWIEDRVDQIVDKTERVLGVYQNFLKTGEKLRTGHPAIPAQT